MSYACLCPRAHPMDPWPLELRTQLKEEDSRARLSKRHFLRVASSSCKAVHWLLLNARKSRMCQAHAARERGMNQSKDPYRWQQLAAGLLLPIGCHTVPHHRAANAVRTGCRDCERDSQWQNVNNRSEARRKCSGLL